MSYEYELIFEESKSLQDLFEKLLASGVCKKATHEELHIKNQQSNTLEGYDARLLKCDDTRAWLEILIPTPYLYQLFSAILLDAKFRCFEDGDRDDEVSLRQAFRLKNI
ncbi:hypothetical protein [Pseudomonas putida]|uniref:hypothetical protein n=1 Tax=Pseudomonas putida TaxID=303 RepID=UPI0012AC7433|nr:hypothetical protein [Pseudomonas putida]